MLLMIPKNPLCLQVSDPCPTCTRGIISLGNSAVCQTESTELLCLETSQLQLIRFQSLKFNISVSFEKPELTAETVEGEEVPQPGNSYEQLLPGTCPLC